MKFIFAALIFSFSGYAASENKRVVVATKNFTESYILGEIGAQIIDNLGVRVEKRQGLSGTGITYEALITGEIDVYPEYTGTIIEVLLKKPGLTKAEFEMELDKLGLISTETLGFNNTYAIAVRRSFAEKNNLVTISDLVPIQSQLSFAFSYEFMNREDGYPRFSETYGFNKNNDVKSMDHALTYTAIGQDEVNVIEVYSTDGKIKKLDLVVLEDNLEFFPRYDAVFLARKSFAQNYPQLWRKLTQLESQISEQKMIEMNSAVENDKVPAAAVAEAFLKKTDTYAEGSKFALWNRIWSRTQEHLLLVFVSLVIATLIGIPLGVAAYRKPQLGQFIVGISSGVQTIPSLALLCFFIPVLGVGLIPALVALCLYSLLPILLNTLVGLKNIDESLRESSRALGLTQTQILSLIEIPLASRSILTGIKTSGIINIGTATLAALIGAGGYGASIIRGLSLNDIPTILEGAIPAAVLALLFQFVFIFVEKALIPKGLQLKEN